MAITVTEKENCGTGKAATCIRENRNRNWQDCSARQLSCMYMTAFHNAKNHFVPVGSRTDRMAKLSLLFL